MTMLKTKAGYLMIPKYQMFKCSITSSIKTIEAEYLKMFLGILMKSSIFQVDFHRKNYTQMQIKGS